ncbi:MAG: hypothetical protein JO214_20265 [Frankiaceae bacterium]|nr:hypothetical protein [Frankiaceae bacterium]
MTSEAKAYQFLDRVMDRRATGSTRRLVRSYVGGPLARKHYTDSVTYDDALVIDAYIAAGTRSAIRRARAIANALVFIQRHDPIGDGRIRAAYAPRPLTSTASIRVRDRTSDVGNMAWVGMALARTASVTGDHTYLRAAVRIGKWVHKHCRDTRGPGGYTGGVTGHGRLIRWKSTEHNLDLYGLFEMLAAAGRSRFATDAAWARTFVGQMWSSTAHRFYVGTRTDGRTVNDDEQPEDVNSWAQLSLRDVRFDRAVDWDVRHLAVTGRFDGVSFCSGDRSGVWFEGTAHLADALEQRDAVGDAKRAAAYLSDIRFAQRHGHNSDGRGVIAASKNRLGDCDGGRYFSSMHTGATAWYILALKSVDPFTPLAAH